MKRILPVVGLAVLGALALAFVACSSGSGTAPTGEANRDGGDGNGASVAGVCVEGVPDCVDTVVIGDDGLPVVCADEPNAPPCLDEEPFAPEPPPGSSAYDVTVDFDAASVDEATDSVLAILQSADPSAEVAILERFPPAAVATLYSNDGEFCAILIEQLMDVPGVADAACGPAADDFPADPDEPVTSGTTPIRSDEGIDPDECNLVHNIDACSDEELEDAGIMPEGS